MTDTKDIIYGAAVTRCYINCRICQAKIEGYKDNDIIIELIYHINKIHNKGC